MLDLLFSIYQVYQLYLLVKFGSRPYEVVASHLQQVIGITSDRGGAGVRYITSFPIVHNLGDGHHKHNLFDLKFRRNTGIYTPQI